MFVQDELSYDNYHEHKDRIFRVTHGDLSAEGGKPDLESLRVWGNAPRFKKVFTSFSVLAILIACLGLLIKKQKR
jgi:hypothetical protein